MKTNLFKPMIVSVITICLCYPATSCNQMDDAPVTDLSIDLAVDDVLSGKRAKAVLTLDSSNDISKPFTIAYKVDGQGALIQRIGGQEYFDNAFEPIAQYDNNCRSGSKFWIGLRINHVPTAYFLMPLLPAGEHHVTLTLINAYGVSSTVTRSWTVTAREE